jgi:hypothetical protein
MSPDHFKVLNQPIILIFSERKFSLNFSLNHAEKNCLAEAKKKIILIAAGSMPVAPECKY